MKLMDSKMVLNMFTLQYDSKAKDNVSIVQRTEAK